MKAILLMLCLAVTGCSTMQYTSNAQGNSYSDVQVLYGYPQTKFRNLGIIDFDFYQPGFRQPSVTDAFPKLKDKARQIGGNALIVRNQRIGQNNNRFIAISAEVLFIETPNAAADQP